MALESSLETDEISVPHQSSHWWHPVHFVLSTIKIFILSSPKDRSLKAAATRIKICCSRSLVVAGFSLRKIAS
jgi:hypothetical protein